MSCRVSAYEISYMIYVFVEGTGKNKSRVPWNNKWSSRFWRIIYYSCWKKMQGCLKWLFINVFILLGSFCPITPINLGQGASHSLDSK